MSLFHPHHHTWEIITMAHTKDYNVRFEDRFGYYYNPTVTDENGVSVNWGKPITVFTQECTECHNLRNHRADGSQEPFKETP